MTNETAKRKIEMLDSYLQRKADYGESDHEAMMMAVKALEQQPYEDTISRQAVLDAIDVKAWEFCDYLINKSRNDEQKPVSHFADNLRECVREELPLVQPKIKQEYCEDAISRETLTHDLQKLIESWKKYPVMAIETKGVEAAIGYVKMIPPVQPQPKTGHWIPVSDRLPEYGKEMLTCSNGGFIEIQSLEDGGYWENQKGDWTDFDEVIAWSPLPEPYEPQESEK